MKELPKTVLYSSDGRGFIVYEFGGSKTLASGSDASLGVCVQQALEVELQKRAEEEKEARMVKDLTTVMKDAFERAYLVHPEVLGSFARAILKGFNVTKKV